MRSLLIMPIGRFGSLSHAQETIPTELEALEEHTTDNPPRETTANTPHNLPLALSPVRSEEEEDPISSDDLPPPYSPSLTPPPPYSTHAPLPPPLYQIKISITLHYYNPGRLLPTLPPSQIHKMQAGHLLSATPQTLQITPSAPYREIIKGLGDFAKEFSGTRVPSRTHRLFSRVAVQRLTGLELLDSRGWERYWRERERDGGRLVLMFCVVERGYAGQGVVGRVWNRFLGSGPVLVEELVRREVRR